MALALQGTTKREISKIVGVSPMTVWNVCSDADFQNELKRLRESELKDIEAKVIDCTNVALKTLIRECQAMENDPKDRIHAAEVLINKCFDLRPEASKKALVEMNTHQHLDLSGIPQEKLDNLLAVKPKVIEAPQE